MENFFDIRSGRWIKALRVITILIAIALIIAGFVIGAMDSEDDGNPLDILDFDGSESLEFVVWSTAGIVVSIIHTVTGMALIQLLDNVETLRKKFDSDSVAMPQFKKCSEEAPATKAVNREILQMTSNEQYYPQEVPEEQSQESKTDLNKGFFIVFAILLVIAIIFAFAARVL